MLGVGEYSVVQPVLNRYDSAYRSTEVNNETTNAILEGCKSLAPELLTKDGSFEVLVSHLCPIRAAS